MKIFFAINLLGSLSQDLNSLNPTDHKTQDHRHGVHHPYVPNWSDILPPPPPLELPPPIPSVSSSQVIKHPGSTPQSPKIHSKKSLHQTQNVSIGFSP